LGSPAGGGSVPRSAPPRGGNAADFAPPAGFEHMVDLLDERARGALSELSEEGAASILQVLQDQGGKVNNPSAYVLKSVRNAVKGGGGAAAVGAGGKGPQSAPPVAAPADDGDVPLEELLGPLGSTLDETAVRALESIGSEAAARIVRELDTKGASVRNPSAYVVRAAKNERQGPGAAHDAPAAAPLQPIRVDRDIDAEFDEEMAKLGIELDDKAAVALEEAGKLSATGILRALNAQGGKVNNPNAYIMRAVANELRGPAAKRPRAF